LIDDLEGITLPSHTSEYEENPRWVYCVEVKPVSINYYDETQVVMPGDARSACVDDHLVSFSFEEIEDQWWLVARSFFLVLPLGALLKLLSIRG
jgi:hypothetical protein